MNRCPSRPLVAALCVLVTSVAVRGQDAVCPANPCAEPGIVAEDITNAELVGVLDYTPATDTRSGTVGRRLCCRNLAVAAILSRLDIDGDGVADNSPDTDGDGLPDNWETGGFESLTAGGELVDRVVYFPAPSAIVPGTPPTPIFTRLAVATSALDPDTDGDGVSDFDEVFGLTFIDEDRDGRLEANEWVDRNSDGLPSPGEFPIDNTGEAIKHSADLAAFSFLHDFDGFIFTDPTNRDTDGDGEFDGADNDPLINPQAFGNLETIIVRFNAEGNADIDQDGLGNGMDMGNDIVSSDAGADRNFQVIDNPENVADLLNLFRQDLLVQGVIPEAQIEDLLGADWDGNGLWRSTDVRTWYLVIDENDPELAPPAEYFKLDPNDEGSPAFYAEQSFSDVSAVLDDSGYDPYGGGVARQQGRAIGMGWQDLLKPNGTTEFIPDERVWAILYAWRVPGFDIDGDGFVGVPVLSSTAPSGTDAEGRDVASVALSSSSSSTLTIADDVLVSSTSASDRPFDDRIDFVDAGTTNLNNGQPTLDGRIDVPAGFPGISCGAVSGTIFLLMFVGLTAMRRGRRI